MQAEACTPKGSRNALLPAGLGHGEIFQPLVDRFACGGGVVLLEPVHKGFLHRVLAMDLSEFESIMQEAGFQIRSHVPMHFWPARLALAFFALPNWLTAPAYRIGQLIMRLPGFRRMGDYTAIRAVAARES